MKLDTLFSALLLLSALFCSVESWRRRRRRRCYRNCTPQSWAPWSTCSRSCGTGTQTRRRGIAVPAICGGTCNVALQETKLCVTQNVNCGWSWNGWAPCSATCGMSTQARTMRITQRPICGGTACPTIQIQTRSCNTGAWVVKSLSCSVCVFCQSHCLLCLGLRFWVTVLPPVLVYVQVFFIFDQGQTSSGTTHLIVAFNSRPFYFVSPLL